MNYASLSRTNQTLDHQDQKLHHRRFQKASQVLPGHHLEVASVLPVANMSGCITQLTTGYQANVTTTTNHLGTMNAQHVKTAYQRKTKTTYHTFPESVDGPSYQKRWLPLDLDIIHVTRERKVEKNTHKKLLTEICHLTNKWHSHPWMNLTAMSHRHTHHQTQEEMHLP